MDPAPFPSHTDLRSSPPVDAGRAEAGAEDVVRLADVAAFFLRNAALIAATALGVTVVALGLVLGFHTPTYRAAALLVVSEQAAVEGYRVPVLPVEGYVRLLSSRAVLREATRLAEQRGVESAGILPGDRLSVRSIELRRGEPGTVSMLDLQALGPTGEAAAALANSWGEALIAIDSRGAQRAALAQARLGLQDSRLKLLERSARFAERLEVSRQLLAATPPLLTMRSRLGGTDLLAAGAAGLEGPGPALISQEANPVHTDLAAKLAALEIDLQVIEPQLVEAERGLAAVEAALARLSATEESAAGEDAAAGEAAAAGEPSTDPGAANLAVARALSVRGAVSMLRQAMVPAHPQPARRLAKVLFAAAGGVILACLIAAAREGWRGRKLR
jgi:hypothetical protein